MKALLLWDSWHVDAGNYRIAHAANALASMGIDYQYRLIDSTSPSVADVNNLISASEIDIVVVPSISSTNRPTVARFIDGSINCPVFCLDVFTSHTDIKGTSGFAEAGAVFAEGRFTNDTTKQLWTNVRRYTLDAGVSAPEETTALVEGTDGTSIVAWKYTPDTEVGNYVYYSAMGARYNLLHYLVQESINDGGLSAISVSKAPLILSIDHLNGGGLFLTGGGTELGGFQYQPDKIQVLGDILRSHNGVCYTDMEQRWILDNGTAPLSGTTTGDLLANIQEYNDVFKICATHDHNNEYTTTTTPWIDSRTKTFMDNSYQAVKAAIEGIGISIDTTLATFATNKYSHGWFELGSPDITHTSSVDDLTVKSGYGFKAVRSSPNHVDGYPKGSVPNTTTAEPMLHFLKSKAQFRGIAVLCGRDGGAVNNNVDSVDKVSFNSCGQGFEALCNGTVLYYHHDDFEDVSVQPSGTSTAGLNNAYGLLTWTVMSGYADMCPDTVDFGANLNNYL